MGRRGLEEQPVVTGPPFQAGDADVPECSSGLTPPGYMMLPLRGWRAGTYRYGDPGAYAAGLYDVAPSGLACRYVPIRRPRGLRRRAI